MDRLQLKTKFAERLEDFELEDYGLKLKLRPLSALERAKIVDKHKKLERTNRDSDNAIENVTIETQCFIVARGLVNETGNRIYQDDEAQQLAEEIPCKALDKISARILEISGMTATAATELKNFSPTPNGDSSVVLQ